MNITPVNSYTELNDHIKETGRTFLLIYKSGSPTSDCALERITSLQGMENAGLLTVDVNEVKDIHPRIGVDTAPSLILFSGGKMVNILKGCQTGAVYESALSGKKIGTVQPGEKKKAKSVTIYTTPTCSWCTTLKTYLKEVRVPFREVNVAADTAAAEAMVKKSGQQGVPQTEINGQMIVGFDKARINQLLEIH